MCESPGRCILVLEMPVLSQVLVQLGLREIDVRCQRSSVPSKSLKTVPKWQCLVGVQARTAVAKSY